MLMNSNKHCDNPYPKNKTRWTLEELVYLCKYYEHDGIESIAFGLERGPTACSSAMYHAKKKGRYEFYKNYEEDTT